MDRLTGDLKQREEACRCARKQDHVSIEQLHAELAEQRHAVGESSAEVERLTEI